MKIQPASHILTRPASVLRELLPLELEVIERRLVHSELEQGEILFREGDPGNELFILDSGLIGAKIGNSGSAEIEIAEFQPGTVFGEMSIFENEPRSATCYAKKRSKLFSLHQTEFYKLMDAYPKAAIRIMSKILELTKRRIEATSIFLSDMIFRGESVRKRAITDSFTGLYNRRYLEESLWEACERAKNKNNPFAIIMIDLDHFHDINEEYSRAIGDKIIIETVNVFRKHVRPADMVTRYGGDEFVLILPSTTVDEAKYIAASISESVSKLDVPDKNSGVKRITLSQGVAGYPQHGTDSATLLDAADQALYRAKKAGRDRVFTADVCCSRGAFV